MMATVFCSIPVISFAFHPLITDDTGTQGKGKFQLEINGEYGHDKEDGVTKNTTQTVTTLTYGWLDNMDIAIGMPYQYIRTKDSEGITRHDGMSDLSIDLKWRFHERDGFSLALKPGITLPTGDYERGLGAGRMTYGVFFIVTQELKPFIIHANLGYRRNENKIDERRDIWHASLAGELEIIKGLKAVANIGVERNPDKASNTHPAFVIGGLVYSVTDNFDIDIGIKGGLNKPETDITTMAGITLRF
ncbi:transporter [hot springs metagenome]